MMYFSSSYGNISHVGEAQHSQIDSEGMSSVYIRQPQWTALTNSSCIVPYCSWLCAHDRCGCWQSTHPHNVLTNHFQAGPRGVFPLGRLGKHPRMSGHVPVFPGGNFGDAARDCCVWGALYCVNGRGTDVALTQLPANVVPVKPVLWPMQILSNYHSGGVQYVALD